MKNITHLTTAQELDHQDKLAHFRERFVHHDPDLIYLDGNSLGRLPGETAVSLNHLVNQQWGGQLIRGWSDGWIEMPTHIGSKIAQLIGANGDEVIIADSTSVNLFKLALAAVQAQPERHKIITDNLNFPSDLYILQGIQKIIQRPLTLQIIPSADGIHGPIDGIAAALDKDAALLTLSHTAFKSGYTYDITAVTQLAHDVGALVLWDLSHSVGVVPIDLNRAKADLAVGCTYKYLNGGPGAPAFLYVQRDLQNRLQNPISGWMGQQNAFNFELTYTPKTGIQQFLTGTPSILALQAIETGIDLLLEAGVAQIRAKSIQQTEYLLALYDEWLAPLAFQLNSPRDPAVRGSHISLGHAAGWQIDQTLIHEMDVLPDFRRPDNLRLGIAPLYTRFVDVRTAVSRLHTVVTQKLYEKYSASPQGNVT